MQTTFYEQWFHLINPNLVDEVDKPWYLLIGQFGDWDITIMIKQILGFEITSFCGRFGVPCFLGDVQGHSWVWTIGDMWS